MPRRASLILTLLFTVLCAAVGYAADHGDGPMAVADPAADIADVYAWMSSDTTKINLAMTVGRGVTQFSDQVQYVFHTTSKDKFLDATGRDTDIICQFTAAQQISCWVGDAFVTGNASGTAGITGGNGRLRAFAGLRNDAFFFNLSGFRATAAAVAAAASSLTFDAAGCPALDAATSTALVTQLTKAPGGGAPADNFAGQNILTIVLEIDRALVTSGGPIVGVWGSTRRR